MKRRLRALLAAVCAAALLLGLSGNARLISEDREYTLRAGENTGFPAVLGGADNAVARNDKTGLGYPSVSGALAAANPGETVYLLRDAVLDGSAAVPAGVTLYVPYADGIAPNDSRDGTKSDSPTIAAEDKTFCTLSVPQNATLAVEGVLRVGGVTGYPAQYYQGHTSGEHGAIANSGVIEVRNGGMLDCFGTIRGSGRVNALSGAVVYEPFIVYDYAGGTNTKELAEQGQSPFTQYTMQNIRCTMELRSGAQLVARCSLYAAAVYNKADAVLIGSSAAPGLITLKDGAVLTRTVDPGTVFSGNADVGRVTYSMAGGASFHALGMTILGRNVTTANVLFPIPYGYRYELNSGTYELNTDTVLMPGAVMQINTDAELNVNDTFMVLSGLRQNSLSGKAYPTTEQLKADGFASNGVLLLNGRMNLAEGVSFGGIVQTGSVGAVLVTAAASDGKDCYTNAVTLGAATEYGSNAATLPLVGQIRINGRTEKLTAGETYIAVDTNPWTLPGYDVLSAEHGSETVTAEQSMTGSFQKKSDSRPHGDLDGDGKVGPGDVTYLAKYLIGSVKLTEKEEAAADLNGDGKVDAKDITRMVRILAEPNQ